MSNEDRPGTRRQFWAGLVFGVLAYLIALAFTVPGRRDSGGWWALTLVAFMAVTTLILVIMGLVAVSRRSGRMLAGGLFLSVAVGLAIDATVREVLLHRA